jgi:hypothetical protein
MTFSQPSANLWGTIQFRLVASRFPPMSPSKNKVWLPPRLKHPHPCRHGSPQSRNDKGFPPINLLKTAAQARALIIEGLRQIHDFPSEGVTVTVYGFQPWSAMLTFAPNSTTLANATRYRKILAEIVYDLRKNFEVDIDPDSDEHAR